MKTNKISFIAIKNKNLLFIEKNNKLKLPTTEVDKTYLESINKHIQETTNTNIRKIKHFNDYQSINSNHRFYFGSLENNDLKIRHRWINIKDIQINKLSSNIQIAITDFIKFSNNKYLKLFNFENPNFIEAPVIRRESVAIVLENNQNQILCLKWNNTRKWKSLIGGGIEDNNIIQSAIDEIQEETGYTNIQYIKKLKTKCHDKFYAEHKNVNRYIINTGIVFKLIDNKRIQINEKELQKHIPIWVDKNKVLDYLSSDLENHKILLKEYLGKKQIYDNLLDFD